jgi:putative oxidoreductase
MEKSMTEISILVLRGAVGIVMIAHGLPKMFWKREVFNKKWKKEYSFPLGSVLLTGIVQVVGGLAILVGIFTQLFSLVLVLNMLVATYVSIRNHREPFLSTPEGKGWDINFLLVGALIAIVFLGSGAWSLVGL